MPDKNNEQTTEFILTQEYVSEKLLWPLWRCIQDEYKEKYKREVWDHFENAVRSAAYTGSMKTYLTNFQNKLPIDLQMQYIKDIKLIIDSGYDIEILNWLRSETTYMVMVVRLMNQERKENFEHLNNNEL